MTTVAFSQNVNKLFSELKLVTDNRSSYLRVEHTQCEYSGGTLYLCTCFNVVLEERGTSDWEERHGNLQGERTKLCAWSM